MTVRPVQPEDAAAWERMRQQLWPSAPGEHAAEIERFFEGRLLEPVHVLVAEQQPGGHLIGFAELSLRNIAEGCRSSPVAYLEGWFVQESERRRSVGTALLRAAEQWGRTQGCTEFASDTELANTVSAAVHRALGFEEVERIVCFRKDL